MKKLILLSTLTMKKIILILTLSSLLFSCSNGGNASNNDNNPPLTATPVNDIDGNTYNTVVIGSQVWTQRNLDVTHYRNGDVIPQVTNEIQWNHLTSGAWCYYNNDPANASYGKLYNAYAVYDPRGLAPQGYHIPSKSEFNALINQCHYIMQSHSIVTSIDVLLRETGFAHWGDPNPATNETGFTALGSGYRAIDEDGNGNVTYNHFEYLKGMSCMWTSTPFPGSALRTQSFNIYSQGEPNTAFASYNKCGYSVRCIKD
jgi:uncharacterized protein (TIGR02145 family)